MDKKNNSMIIIVAVIVLAIIAVIILKVGVKKPTPQPLSQTEIELNQAVASNTTKSISDNLNSINVDEAVGTDELITVDQELQKL